MRLGCTFLLFLYVNITQANILNKLSDSLLSLLGKTNSTTYSRRSADKSNVIRYFLPSNKVADDIGLENEDTNLHGRRFEEDLRYVLDESSSKLTGHLEVSNEDIERRALEGEDFRRYKRVDLNRNWIYSRSIGSESSSAEERAWKNEYKYKWKERKKDALQDPVTNGTRGHIVNMAAARPWRVPCGDPNQIDMPTGSCCLSYECPPEYRVFRGDYFCGKTGFVCCSAQILERDMYEAFDPTITDTSSFSTSSDEVIKEKKGSREIRHRKKHRKRYRTLKARYRRKRFIKKTIRKLAKEVRKELNRAFRNNTENRRRVIRNLKILIKKMKTKFRDERHIAKFQLDLDLANINLNLAEKLKQIRGLNYNFLTNDTFQAIVVNGTAGRTGPQMFEAYPELDAAYPELSQVFKTDTRRTGGGIGPIKTRRKQMYKPKDYLEYDIEFGMFT